MKVVSRVCVCETKKVSPIYIAVEKRKLSFESNKLKFIASANEGNFSSQARDKEGIKKIEH
jgi:hypothetical protein